MKLIGSLTSPYVRKVRIVLAEKKIDYELVLDSPWEAGNSVSSFNPLGKVPVLILDDETPLYDSRVIVEYLDATAPNNRLIPAAGRERILVKRWEALADGVNDAAATGFLEGKRAPEKRSDEWIARQRGKIYEGLKVMAVDLGEQPWCHGNGISLADIAVGAALGYLDFRYADIDWHASHANLARLFDKLMQRASFSESVPRA
jgi:glutathione S-transferase